MYIGGCFFGVWPATGVLGVESVAYRRNDNIEVVVSITNCFVSVLDV